MPKVYIHTNIANYVDFERIKAAIKTYTNKYESKIEDEYYLIESIHKASKFEIYVNPLTSNKEVIFFTPEAPNVQLRITQDENLKKNFLDKNLYEKEEFSTESEKQDITDWSQSPMVKMFRSRLPVEETSQEAKQEKNKKDEKKEEMKEDKEEEKEVIDWSKSPMIKAFRRNLPIDEEKKNEATSESQDAISSNGVNP